MATARVLAEGAGTVTVTVDSKTMGLAPSLMTKTRLGAKQPKYDLVVTCLHIISYMHTCTHRYTSMHRHICTHAHKQMNAAWNA